MDAFEVEEAALMRASRDWAKAAATGESERQACERNGGAWDTAAGFCEIESKARGKQ